MPFRGKFAFAPIEQPSMLLTLPGAILSWALSFAVVWALVAVLGNTYWVYAMSLSETDLAQTDQYWFSTITYLFQTWFAVAVTAWFVWWIKRGETRPLATAGFVPASGRDKLTAFLLALAVVVVNLGLAELPATLNPSALADPLALTAEGLKVVPPWPTLLNVAVLIVMVVAIPSGVVAEEVLYRGWMLSALAPIVQVPAAVGISGVIFALTHIGPSELTNTGKIFCFFMYIAFTASTALIAIRQGIWPAIAYHFGQNLALLSADFIYGGGDMRYVIASLDSPRGTDDGELAKLSLCIELLSFAVIWAFFPQRSIIIANDAGPDR